MQDSDFRMIGTISAVLGFLFLVGGAIVWLVTNGYMGIWTAIYYLDYRGYVAPLLIFGIVLLVVGVVFSSRSSSQSNTTNFPPTPQYYNIPARPQVQTARFCKYCGKELMPNSVYCPNCGLSSR